MSNMVDRQYAEWARRTQLPAIAQAAVRTTSESGVKRYPGEDWYWQGVEEHLGHAGNLTGMALSGVANGTGEVEGETVRVHIEHAIWRLSAALYFIGKAEVEKSVAEEKRKYE